MITFKENDKEIILSYSPEQMPVDLLVETFRKRTWIKISRVFSFTTDDWFNSEFSENMDEFKEDEISFRFATLQSEYYEIRPGIITKNISVFIHKDIPFLEKYFIAKRKVSVFRTIEKLITEDVYIDGKHPNAIPINEFTAMLTFFPNDTELKKYVEGRISAILRNYLDTAKDAEESYKAYMNKRLSEKGVDLDSMFNEYEILKYQRIYDKLTMMLASEGAYTETQWQREILQIILLLYPKYIRAFREVGIQLNVIGDKVLDYILVDFSGHVDIIEIKQPFDKCIVTEGLYRKNYIPRRELSGAIMQLEKYIFALNRWGDRGEKYLTVHFSKKLPAGMNIKITNPGGIIIMGRDYNLSMEQRRDFEVIKRKYRNVIDIITYDNLLERLKFTIVQLQM